MKLIQNFVQENRDLFHFCAPESVHPHDMLMAKSVLRFFPRSITPNMVTLFRIVMTPLVFFLIFFKQYTTGLPVFLFVAFTDVIDGSLARTRNQITKFGMMFDPLADKLLVGSLVFLLVFQLNTYLALTVLFVEILFIGSGLVLKLKFKTTPMANVWGKMKMLLQVVATCMTMIAFLINFPLLLSIAVWTFGIALGFAIISLFTHGI